jgi:hypothetical protein
LAGETSQGNYATAVGDGAGQSNQGTQATAVGRLAGRYNQGDYATAVGRHAGQTSQGIRATAVGIEAGSNNQGFDATAVGDQAGLTTQGSYATAVGRSAGRTSQGLSATAVGLAAGEISQGNYATAVGNAAGYTSQGLSATAVGDGAGQSNQGIYTVAMGVVAGRYNQGDYAVAIGPDAGETSQGSYAVAMGYAAGETSQGTYAVAVGDRAGLTSQGASTVAVGVAAGRYNQGASAVAVGSLAGVTSQGSNAVAVGNGAGQTSQHANSIVLNATGSTLDTAQASSFYVKPVRGGDIAASALAYTSAGEIVEETSVHFDASGNMGIGTSAPLEFLHVQYPNPTYGSTVTTEHSNVVISSGSEYSDAGLFFRTPFDVTSPPKCALIASGSGYSGYDGQLDICFDTTNNNGAAYRAKPSNAKVTFKANGNVGIGGTNIKTKLHITHDGPDYTDSIANDRVRIMNRVTTGDAQYIGNEYGLQMCVSGTGNSSIQTIGYTNSTDTVEAQYNLQLQPNGGNVGIGTNSPAYKLDVNGTLRAYGITDSSDRRIKSNIVDVNDASALETIRLLKPKKYDYRDTESRTHETVWGFIAQDVREVLPYATDVISDYIPNVMEYVNVSSSNVLTFDTSVLESNVVNLRLKDIHGDIRDVTIDEIIDGNTIRVIEDLDAWTGSFDAEGNVITATTTTTITVEEYEALEDTTGYESTADGYTKTTTTYPGSQIFVYGQKVDDFHTLQKNAIWTVATAALQEVDRQLQAEKVKTASLESQVVDLLARVTALENI